MFKVIECRAVWASGLLCEVEYVDEPAKQELVLGWNEHWLLIDDGAASRVTWCQVPWSQVRTLRAVSAQEVC